MQSTDLRAPKLRKARWENTKDAVKQFKVIVKNVIHHFRHSNVIRHERMSINEGRERKRDGMEAEPRGRLKGRERTKVTW